MDKKKILICVDWYTPGFKAGGPIRSVSNIVSYFKNDYDFYILTSAYDLGDHKPYTNVVLNQWHDQEGVFIKYLDRSRLNYPTIKSNLYEVNPDVLYLNSLFSKDFTLYPLRYARKYSKKVILAPRGMLGKGALEIKQNKKRMFLSIAKILGLYKNVVWHASTDEEVAEVKKVFGNHSKVRVAQNIPVKQNFTLDEVLAFKQTGKIKFIFISRISRKKNLHLAIEALKEIKVDRPVEFDIYGVNEDRAYFDSFKKHFGKVSKYLTINYKGEVHPDHVAELFAKADFMLLPSKHENFGHTIVEAWANGCPVIISQNTPWRDLEEKKIGWDIDISNPTALIDAINHSIGLDFETYKEYVISSYRYFENTVMDKKIIDDHQLLLSV